MKKKHMPFWGRIVVLLIIFAMSFPIPVSAAEPRASDYLDSYQAYVYPAGNGEVQVWFSVTGDDYMDEIGALSIHLYESTDNTNWKSAKTFRHSSYTNMLAEDDIQHVSHVSYQGVAGRYYKAYVCIWAGIDGGGDTRYFWTSAKKAT